MICVLVAGVLHREIDEDVCEFLVCLFHCPLRDMSQIFRAFRAIDGIASRAVGMLIVNPEARTSQFR